MKNQSVVLSLVVIAVLLIARCSSPVKTPSQTETGKPIANPVNSGKLLFEEKCAVCHGPDGTAGISNAANLQKSQLDTNSILQVITQGKNAMPAFAEQLSPEEIKQIANYAITLRK